MQFQRVRLEELIYGGSMARRFTQDSPILPDVWFEYALRHQAIDLLLTPYQMPGPNHATAGELSVILRARLEDERSRPSTPGFPPMEGRESPRIAYNQSTVLARIWFDELIRVVLPMSSWWAEQIIRSNLIRLLSDPAESRIIRESTDLILALNDPGPPPSGTPSPYYLEIDKEQKEAIRRLKDYLGKKGVAISVDVLWMIRVIGTIAAATRRCLAQSPAAPAAAPAPKGKRRGKTADAGPNRQTVWPPEAAPPHDLNRDAFLEHRRRRHKFLDEAIEAVVDLLQGLHTDDRPGRAPLYSASLNRRAGTSVMRSRGSVKADAAHRVFDLSCKDIIWAVIDSGIDATHPAFRPRLPMEEVPAVAPDPTDPGRPHLYQSSAFDANDRLQSRVLETYDFTRIQALLSLEVEDQLDEGLAKKLKAIRAEVASLRKRKRGGEDVVVEDPLAQLRRNLQKGRDIDWGILLPFLRVDHVQKDGPGKTAYQPPVNEHGTHVAGILGGDWGDKVQGICPDIRLIDLRVLDEQGQGDEFNVIAALQFVRYLRSRSDFATVHGVNLSLSIRHDVANYACGRTPVCEECERLIGSGLVVVAAAGNEGYQQYTTPKGQLDAFRSISITDPGNAEGVITVGSTHRFQPHTYGVSYFSSRGPTGDGRAKPDLVAPGEKIEAPVPGDGEGLRRMDGTSMAAPHVSGAAALLISRHRELSGRPEQIKQILCSTTTDLGRERYFQGHGMVDILRALQSI